MSAIGEYVFACSQRRSGPREKIHITQYFLSKADFYSIVINSKLSVCGLEIMKA
jgi:hypothetical protein